MSAALEAKAELVKLRRLLAAGEQELAYLEPLGPDALRELRLSATDLLFDGEGGTMARLAAGARLLPAGALATIAERAFGPLLCARIAGYVDPGKAVEVAAKLKPRFLADVAIEIDPRKASVVIGRIPPAHAAAVAEILAAEDEFVTMGRFLGHLEPPAIEACLQVIPDSKLLPTAFVLEDKSRLEGVMALLDDDRAARVAADAAEAGHWAEALDLAEHVSEERAGHLADVVAALEEPVLATLVEAATAGGLWPDLLPVSRAMSLEARRRFARVEAIGEPEVLAQMVDATVELGLWEQLLPLVAELPAPARERLALIAAERSDALGDAVRAAIEHDLWMPLLSLAAQFDGETQERLIDVAVEADPDVIAELVAAVERADAWEVLAELAQGLPPERLERIGAEAERLGVGEKLARIIAS